MVERVLLYRSDFDYAFSAKTTLCLGVSWDNVMLIIISKQIDKNEMEEKLTDRPHHPTGPELQL